MMLKTSLVLLAIIGIIAGIEEYKKVDEVLKKVGKRYLLKNQKLTRMMVDRRMKVWKDQSPDRVKTVKHDFAERLTFHIRWQSSSQNKGYEEHAKVLFDLMDDDMTAEVCEEKDTKYNKVQFARLLKKNRGEYDAVRDDASYFYLVMPTENDVLKVEIGVEGVSHDVKSTTLWEITGNYDTKGEKGQFKINHIKMGGGCITQGTIDHKFTEIGTRQEALEKLKKEKNPNVQALFDLFTPGPMKFREQNTDKIATIWLEGLDADGFEGTVCDDGQEEKRKYTRGQFLSWYDRFSVMWHPKAGDLDYITVQMVNIDDKELTARVTMSLEIGIKDPETFDWNFMIFAKLENDKWKVAKVNVLCHPTLMLMDKSLVHSREYIFNSFVDNFQNTPEPAPGHKSVEFLRQFTKTRILSYEFCDKAMKLSTIADLEVNAFSMYKDYNMELSSYFLDYTDFPLPATKISQFKMRTLLTKDKKRPATLNFENEWIFNVKWDDYDQFYYIDSIKISCPKVAEKDYKQFMKFSRSRGK